jgi:hypothetical protein
VLSFVPAQIASELRNRRPELFVDKLARADFYAALKRQMSLKSRLRLGQLAFPRNPLMLFICTFDAVFIFVAVVRELFSHFIDAARHIATDCRLEHYALTDVEFVRRHRGNSNPLH